MSGISCGIDFGTSNTTSALVSAEGDVQQVLLEGENSTLPSALFFCDNSNILYGREGVQAYIEGEDGRLMRGLKSVLGTDLMEERTLINRRSISFMDVLSVFLKHVKVKAEKTANMEISNVVIGRPVHFHNDDLGADQKSQDILEKIAHMIGFKNVEFQFEPIAAAFSHEQDIAGEKLSLVVDLGGGTSDFTLIRLSENRKSELDRSSDILSTSGVRVGGTNFDEALSLKSFMPEFGLGSQYKDPFDSSRILEMPMNSYFNLSHWAKVHRAQTAKAILSTKEVLRTALEPKKVQNLYDVQNNQLGHALLQLVEQAKIELTQNEESIIACDDIIPKLEILVKRAVFEESIVHKIQNIEECLDECLITAGCRAEDVGLLILTGGSTELPIVNQMIARKFPNAELSKGNKFDSVGLGLAYTAKQIF